ncbi:hypothetical protein [Saccharothrix obliqua]|uniref:hypothetical protein n=1 Tax=Saccharothrix obliqua TaxID=2861747 RepID=UPI001C5EB415|nr:hypothetical protein [Saccharothrix obliqua]MBW4717237.1 hypothetical protein [Saccharothrix obliqua]
MKFDVVVGMDEKSFSLGVAELHKREDAHKKFFQGTVEKSPFKCDWNVVDAPAVVFGPPDPGKWAASYDGSGKHPAGPVPPAGNTFRLHLPKLHIVLYSGGKPQPAVEGPVEIYAQVAVSGGKLTITPLAVWFDESKMDPNDRAFVAGFVLPAVFKQVGGVLKGIDIPPLHFAAGSVPIDLRITEVTLGGGRLLIAALADKSNGAAAPATWPTASTFVLVNRDYLGALVGAAAANFKGKDLGKFDKGGSAGSISGSAKLEAIKNVKILDDPTTASAGLDVSFDLTAKLLGSKCALSKAAKKS